MNKTFLWALLAVSALLFLYPSITTLLDVLNTIGNAPAVPTAVIETRDRAVMQVLGFMSLYVFLGFLLYNYNLQPSEQTNFAQHNGPSIKKYHISRKIDTVWCVPVSTLVFLALIAYEYFSGLLDATDMVYGYFLPIFYSVIASLIAGLITYGIIKKLTEE